MRPPIASRTDLHGFLAAVLPKGKFVHFDKHQVIFSHGQHSDSMFYIQQGFVKLTVTSTDGKEAVVGIFNAGQMFGESCLALNSPVRFHNAVAVTDVQTVQIGRKVMTSLLVAGGKEASGFVAYLLQRNEGIQQAFTETLMQSSKQRLGSILLALRSAARSTGEPIPQISQQTLAQMLGISRQRVNALYHSRR